MNISRSLREIVKKEKVRMTHLAKAIGVHRVSLYTSLADDGNPERKTIEKILSYLGYDLKFIKRREAKRTNLKPSKKKGR
jgi:probable addiction module antidote protein